MENNKDFEEMAMKRCDLAVQESEECVEYETMIEQKSQKCNQCNRELLEAHIELLGVAETVCYKRGFIDAMRLICSQKM